MLSLCQRLSAARIPVRTIFSFKNIFNQLIVTIIMKYWARSLIVLTLLQHGKDSALPLHSPILKNARRKTAPHLLGVSVALICAHIIRWDFQGMIRLGKASSQDHWYNRNLSWYLKLLLLSSTLGRLKKKKKWMACFLKEHQLPVNMERKEENPNGKPHSSTFILVSPTKPYCNRPYPNSPKSYYSPWSEIKEKIIALISSWCS